MRAWRINAGSGSADAWTVGAIFEDPSQRRKFLTDGIGPGEVFGAAGLLALLDERFDFSGDGGLGGITQEADDLVQAIKESKSAIGAGL